MPDNLNKIIFGGLAAFLLFLLSMGACSYWMRQSLEEAEAVKPEAEADGASFGRGTDELGCVKEAVARSEQDQSIKGTAAASFFLDACLKTSAATPGFCDEVPKWNDRFNSKAWAAGVCNEFGRSDTYCRKVLERIPPFCDYKSPFRQ